MKIISATDRLAEKRGVKALIVGPSGVGKTSLLRTLDPAATLFIDIEAGDLSVQDVPVDTIRVDDWPTARDLACRIAGPNPSFPPTACYSQAHYEGVGGALENLDKYDVIFVDSITAITRLSFRWSEQEPEAFSERSGRKDVRSAYGLHGREMISWLQHLMSWPEYKRARRRARARARASPHKKRAPARVMTAGRSKTPSGLMFLQEAARSVRASSARRQPPPRMRRSG